MTAWDEEFSALEGELKETFSTFSQLAPRLRTILSRGDCPLLAVQVLLDGKLVLESAEVEIPAGAAVFSQNDTTEGEKRATREIRWWKKRPTDNINTAKIFALFSNLFYAVWRPELRTGSAGLCDLKRTTHAVELLDTTLQKWVHTAVPFAVLFCDLDGFKQVNDTFGQAFGDKVIRQFGEIIEDVAANDKMPFHYGGDEFLLVVPSISAETAISIAYKIIKRVLQHDFETNQRILSCSIGISYYGKMQNKCIEGHYIKDAEKGLKQEVKAKVKGLARFYPYEKNSNPCQFDQHLLVHCIVKSAALEPRIFANVWLNSISAIVSEEVSKGSNLLETVAESVDNFLDMAGIRASEMIGLSSSLSLAVDGLDVSPVVTASDIALAISHGYYHGHLVSNTPGGNLIVDLQAGAVGLDASVIWPRDGKITDRATDFGEIWELVEGSPPGSAGGARALLVRIGHAEVCLPSCLFSDEIIIDERPSRGGGLPDFWAAAVARVASSTISNPNVERVYVLGNPNYASSTIGKLEDINNKLADATNLSTKTSISTLEIETFLLRLGGKIRFPAEVDELLSDLSSLVKKKHTLLPMIPTSSRSDPFLKRNLNAHSFQLKQVDGCHLNTAAESFPVVLEIVRNATSVGIIQDQAGQELRELCDFKVHLDLPLQDRVPHFYRDEHASFNAYFQNHFLDSDGLFRRAFERDGQLCKVLQHVVETIQPGPRRFASRRAILVVPHVVRTEGELSPLGLISIRIIPRFDSAKVILNFSATWRTVEAVVGFPYSLYGTICFAESLCKTIRACSDVPIEMGWVSYIAHSLHFFTDRYAINIARKIVNDASI